MLIHRAEGRLQYSTEVNVLIDRRGFSFPAPTLHIFGNLGEQAGWAGGRAIAGTKQAIELIIDLCLNAAQLVLDAAALIKQLLKLVFNTLKHHHFLMCPLEELDALWGILTRRLSRVDRRHDETRFLKMSALVILRPNETRPSNLNIRDDVSRSVVRQYLAAVAPTCPHQSHLFHQSLARTADRVLARLPDDAGIVIARAAIAL